MMRCMLWPKLSGGEGRGANGLGGFAFFTEGTVEWIEGGNLFMPDKKRKNNRRAGWSGM